MIVFRLTTTRYARDLSGKGAEMSGGRWNNKGTAMVYTSESRALCILEVAVHLPLGNLPMDFVLISLELPDTSIENVDPSILPNDWKEHPPKSFTRRIGDEFVAAANHLTLKVPSALVPDEHNFLINPKHPDSHKIIVQSIEPFSFDSRFFTR
jgi:RES domain-containing protein